MYATLQQVEAKLPHRLVLEALDDNADGEIDADVQSAWEAAVDAEIDGVLGQRYSVPFTGTIPAVVCNAAIVLRCEALYQRRGIPADQNPFAAQAAQIRKKLDRIGLGQDPLTPEITKAHPSGSIISEPSRLVIPAAGTEPADAPPPHLN